MKINISVGALNLKAELYDNPTGNAIKDALPITSSALTWGDEIYFETPVSADIEPDAKAEVEVGELAFYDPMNAFCIFFGPTPMSYGEQPVAAAPVNVFGRLLSTPVEELQQIRSGEKITVTAAE